jgi:hypothetical protein
MVMDRGRRGGPRQRDRARLALATGRRVSHRRPEPRDANDDCSGLAPTAGSEASGPGGTTRGFADVATTGRGESDAANGARRDRDPTTLRGSRAQGGRRETGRSEAGCSGGASARSPICFGDAAARGAISFGVAGAHGLTSAGAEFQAGITAAPRSTGAGPEARGGSSGPGAGDRQAWPVANAHNPLGDPPACHRRDPGAEIR